MNAKLKAIELASVSGTDVIIASGKNPDNILKIINGEKIGTFFPAKLKIIERKKRWLLNNMSRSKSLTVDEGAKNAILQKNTSLLPPGIISVSGSFITSSTSSKCTLCSPLCFVSSTTSICPVSACCCCEC